MVRKAVITAGTLRAILGHILEEQKLMAPTKRGRNSFAFEWISDPEEVAFTYVRTILPPKQAFLPPREPLLKFSTDPTPEAAPIIADEPFVLFGVHPCDLAGIAMLDWAMTQRHGIADPYYQARRRAATIIGLDYLPDEYCFDSSVGTADTREGADLFLTPIKDGFLVEVLTDKGGRLIEKAAEAREPSPAELAEAEAFAVEREKSTTLRLPGRVEDYPDLFEDRHDSEVWQETAERCYSCGTCTNVCPTCFCFDVQDELNFPITSGLRERSFDSCQFLEFALVAGPHNFRKERSDRVRHRWFRKFVFLHREHGRPFCVGCGRCTQACTADISLTDVIEKVVAEASRKKEKV